MKNAKSMAEALISKGYTLVSGKRYLMWFHFHGNFTSSRVQLHLICTKCFKTIMGSAQSGNIFIANPWRIPKSCTKLTIQWNLYSTVIFPKMLRKKTLHNSPARASYAVFYYEFKIWKVYHTSYWYILYNVMPWLCYKEVPLYYGWNICICFYPRWYWQPFSAVRPSAQGHGRSTGGEGVRVGAHHSEQEYVSRR